VADKHMITAPCARPRLRTREAGAAYGLARSLGAPDSSGGV